MTRMLALTLVALALPTGCDGSGATTSGSSSPPADGTEIDATDGLAFAPARLTVASGTGARAGARARRSTAGSTAARSSSSGSPRSASTLLLPLPRGDGHDRRRERDARA